jgi:hypothetical protein
MLSKHTCMMYSTTYLCVLLAGDAQLGDTSALLVYSYTTHACMGKAAAAACFRCCLFQVPAKRVCQASTSCKQLLSPHLGLLLAVPFGHSHLGPAPPHALITQDSAHRLLPTRKQLMS